MRVLTHRMWMRDFETVLLLFLAVAAVLYQRGQTAVEQLSSPPTPPRLASMTSLPPSPGAPAISVMSGGSALKMPADIREITFSPDGRWLGIDDGSGNVAVWNMQTRQVDYVWRPDDKQYVSVAFSPDSRLLAVASPSDCDIRETDTWRRIQLLGGGFSGDWPDCLSFSSNGRWLATCHGFWDTLTWKRSTSHPGDDARTAAIVPGTDVCILDESAWTVQSGQKLFDLEVPDSLLGESPERLAIAPNGAIAARTSGRGFSYGREDVSLYSARTGKLVWVVPHLGDNTGATFSADGKTLATASGDGTLKLWDWAHQKLKQILYVDAGVECSAYSPDGAVLAVGLGNQSVQLLDTRQLHQYALPLPQRAGTVRRLEEQYKIHPSGFSPDGRWLVSNGIQRRCRIWDTQSARPLHTIQQPVYDVTFSSDGLTALPDIGGEDPEMRHTLAWRKVSGKRANRIANALAVSGNWALGLYENGRHVEVVETGSGRRLRRLENIEQTDEQQTGFLFSPDHRWIAGVQQQQQRILIWSLLTGSLEHTLAWASDSPWPAGFRGVNQADPRRVAFSPDSRLLAAIDGGEVTVWDIKSGKQRLVLNGKMGDSESLAFSPDGRRLAVGNENSTVQVWDTKTGHLVDSYIGPDGAVEAITFRGSRQLVAAGSNYVELFLWKTRI